MAQAGPPIWVLWTVYAVVAGRGVEDGGGRRGGGFVAIVAYAAVAAVQILVWNPLAAVPGSTLPEITAHLSAQGEEFGAEGVVGMLLVGPLLGVVPLVLAVLGRMRALPAAAASVAMAKGTLRRLIRSDLRDQRGVGVLIVTHNSRGRR